MPYGCVGVDCWACTADQVHVRLLQLRPTTQHFGDRWIYSFRYLTSCFQELYASRLHQDSWSSSLLSTRLDYLVIWVAQRL